MKILIILLGVFTAVSAAFSESTQTEITTSEKIANFLGNNQPEQARVFFNANLKSALSAEQMRQAWTQLVAQTGEFDHVVKSIPGSAEGLDVVDVLCATKQAGIKVHVIFDSESLVEGLLFLHWLQLPNN